MIYLTYKLINLKNKRENMIIGIDDTDSPNGMCTTYLAAKLKKKFKIKSTLRLIRLNPNIPYKTRGNGAVAIVTDFNHKIRKEVIDYITTYSHLSHKKTNPGIAFVPKLSRKKQIILEKFYRKVVSEHVSIIEAEDTAVEIGAEVIKFKNGRGIIGALAACGAVLDDKTFELIAYREKRNYGQERKINFQSVFSMNEKFYPKCFDSVDIVSNQILITPHGPDPIFCGIRGKSSMVVKKAWNDIIPLEKIEFIQVFETNQASDDHLKWKKIREIKPFDCVKISGKVSSNPKTIQGGHVFFKLMDETGEIDCGAYRQTGEFRDVMKQLCTGDEIIVYGGIGRHSNTLNLEKICIEKLKSILLDTPPLCCGRKMTSSGKNKGFKCRKCNNKIRKVMKTKVFRDIELGWFEVPPRARRHLSKPLVRFNRK